MADRIEHRTAALEHVTMHYVVAGPGPGTVVLLHGWPQTWYAWRRVIPRFAEAGYRVVAPDLRGLGDTTPAASGCDSAAVAGDVAELMRDHVGAARFHLGGHDWGGPAAAALAARDPGSVQTLTLVDVTVPGLGPDLSQGGRRWHHAFHRTPGLPEALTRGRERVYLSWFYRAFSHRPEAIGPADVDEYLRTYGRPGALGASLAYYRSIPETAAQFRRWAGTGQRLAMPVLGAGGAREEARGRAREPAASLRTVADDVTEAVIADSGHFVPEEQPAALAAAMLELFGRPGTPGAGVD